MLHTVHYFIHCALTYGGLSSREKHLTEWNNLCKRRVVHIQTICWHIKNSFRYKAGSTLIWFIWCWRDEERPQTIITCCTGYNNTVQTLPGWCICYCSIYTNQHNHTDEEYGQTKGYLFVWHFDWSKFFMPEMQTPLVPALFTTFVPSLAYHSKWYAWNFMSLLNTLMYGRI